MLEFNVDNERDNKPNSLNQIMHYADWLKTKKTMQAKYKFFIKNETWELTSLLKN